MSLDQNPTKPSVIRLEDYQEPDYWVNAILLDFDLDPKTTTVRSKMTVRRNKSVQPGSALCLDGEKLALKAVKIDGKVVAASSYQVSDEHLILAEPPDAEVFVLEIETEINPKENKALSGLYMSGGLFTTQCEAEGFRRITYSMDRPDVMSIFKTRVSADKSICPVLLSNGNCTGSGDLSDGRHWAEWEDPFPKPTYLFALVAGDLSVLEDEFVTRSGRTVDLKIYSEPGKEGRCAYAMDALKRSMRWDEETFGLEYDLDIFMIVAVSAFNAGAMENKGLNIFNDKYILADPASATDADYENIEGVVAHEYFHNWTGNRITCREWFQLCLKEGLTVFRDQLFTADMRSASVKRINDVNRLRVSQFDEDAGPLSHPVRPGSFIEIDNFFTTTVYEKGAELCRMLQTLLGVYGFRKGMDLYFERHDGEAATVEEFVGAMADANQWDLSDFLKWYSQSGTPEISYETNYDPAAKTFDLTLIQRTRPTPDQSTKGPLVIPVRMGLVGESGKDVPLQLSQERAPSGTTRVLTLTESETTFRFENVLEPVTPSLFRDFSAPVKVTTTPSVAQSVLLMGADSDPFNRWEAGRGFAVEVLKTMVKALDQGEGPDVPGAFLDANRATLLDETLDPAFKALALTIPSEIEIGQEMDQIRVEPIHEARTILRRALGEAMAPELERIYDVSRTNEEYSPDSEAAGRRAFGNMALGFLAATGKESHRDRVIHQAQNANNMTDKMAALQILTHMEGSDRQVALDAFFEQWKDEATILTKWFALQASSSLPDTFDRVVSLMDHATFSLDVPNKVYALLGTFAYRNQLRFHDASGKGYDLLINQILQLDKINPEVAASLLSEGFSKWQVFDNERQGLMKECLQKVAGASNLSPNLFEIVSKTLG
jgi:aminopeptidase N